MSVSHREHNRAVFWVAAAGLGTGFVTGFVVCLFIVGVVMLA